MQHEDDLSAAQCEEEEVLIERARYTRALSLQLKKLHDEAKLQGQVTPLDISENLRELELVPRRSRQRLPRTAIHKLYPPCQSKFQDLDTMSLSSLTPHTPHEKKKLLVYTTAEATLVGSKTDGESRVGGCYISVRVADKTQSSTRTDGFLELYNCFVRSSIEQILPKGSTLMIKEPFYTLSSSNHSEELVIRVDHPSDIEIIYPFAKTESSSHWKRMGDAAFGLKRYQEAYAWYTKCIELQANEALGSSPEQSASGNGSRLRNSISALSNRAAASLEAGCFDACIRDCNKVLQVEQNFKALYRRARAYYSLRRNVSWEVVEIAEFMAHCKKYADDRTEAVDALIADIESEVSQAAGNFNWSSIQKLAQSNDVLCVANYRSPSIKVVEVLNHGHGVVATSLIRAGTIIAVSTAEAIVYDHDPNAFESIRIDTVRSRCDVGKANELSTLLAGNLARNPSKRRELYGLYAGPEYTRGLKKGDRMVDGLRMYGVQIYNSFALDDSEVTMSCLPTARAGRLQYTGIGVWQLPSYFNHSCLNNCSRTFLANVLVVKTSRDIQPGEELTLGYVNKLHNYHNRKDCFHDFGFVCDCALCGIDAAELEAFPEDCEFREVAVEEYYQYVESAMAKGYLTTAEMLSSAKMVQEVIDNLDANYYLTDRSTMRYGLLRPLNALCALHLAFRDWSAALCDVKAILDLSPPDHGIDDLCLRARTLVAALNFKLSFANASATGPLLGISDSLELVAEAWDVRGLVPGFGGYWDEFGEWWHEFLSCSKAYEDATRQCILRAFLEYNLER